MSRKKDLDDKIVWASDPHTLVKHLVYRHYLECWLPKILQSFPEATIVDAFAGPGIYEDGLPGSPVLIAKTFLEHRAFQRFGALNLICLEKRADRTDELRCQIASLPTSPKLRITVVEPGVFTEQQPRLSAVAHGTDPRRPVLWLLDPFKINSVPFSAVLACVAGPHDEVVLTCFTDEMHRFCESESLPSALNRHFGGEGWRSAVPAQGAAVRKLAFARAYGRALEAQGLLYGQFAIEVARQTARYHLILATHSEAGLKCWNPVTWKLDTYTGAGAAAETLHQPDLFGESYVGELERMLRDHAGSEQTMGGLITSTLKAGFVERQLREALDGLASEGLAIRVHPIKARSPWPADGIVRFYAPEDIAFESVRPPVA
ncbi:three-Cys-motif partner protein TcmP [Embleya sp. NPDC059237]|uniref:three-Cys-motif partner protein TcmP n=1 Tax=Embleya sp. NPDC059237 TaxID=3346784 RepID=UPI00367E373F